MHLKKYQYEFESRHYFDSNFFLNLNIFVECIFDNCTNNETLNLESDDYQYIRGHDPLIFNFIS
jgi:hypothetical protein